MEFLSALWLPIVVAAVLVFVVSSLVHMVFKWHNADCGRLANEDQVLTALRASSPAPGFYMLPRAENMKDMCSPEMVAKFEKGPVAHLTVLPSGPPAIGKALLQWFLYTLLVGVFAGYVGWNSLGAGAHYLQVFRVTGTVALAAYGLGEITASIWKGQPWGSTAKFLFDGLLYALATAGAFGWLWPQVTG
jgi:hypothetical protein